MPARTREISTSSSTCVGVEIAGGGGESNGNGSFFRCERAAICGPTNVTVPQGSEKLRNIITRDCTIVDGDTPANQNVNGTRDGRRWKDLCQMVLQLYLSRRLCSLKWRSYNYHQIRKFTDHPVSLELYFAGKFLQCSAFPGESIGSAVEHAIALHVLGQDLTLGLPPVLANGDFFVKRSGVVLDCCLTLGSSSTPLHVEPRFKGGGSDTEEASSSPLGQVSRREGSAPGGLFSRDPQDSEIGITHAIDAAVPECVEEESESKHAAHVDRGTKPDSRENAETLAMPVEATPRDHSCQEGAAYSERVNLSGGPEEVENMLKSSALHRRNEDKNDSCCLFLSADQNGSAVEQNTLCSFAFRDSFSSLPSVVTWALGPRIMRQTHLPEAGGSATAYVELLPGREIVLNGGEGIVLGRFFTLDTRILAPLPEGDICRGRARSIRRDSPRESLSLLKPVASDAIGLGDKVVLSSNYKEHSDAKRGPLRETVVGQVLDTDQTKNVRCNSSLLVTLVLRPKCAK